MPLPKPTELETRQRFWTHVERREGSECLMWTGALLVSGYGQFKIRVGKTIRAHRYVWKVLYNLPLEDGEDLRHTCGVRICMNVAHMYTEPHGKSLLQKGWSNERSA